MNVPTVHRAVSDGHRRLDWPPEAGATTEITRELLESIIAEVTLRADGLCDACRMAKSRYLKRIGDVA